MVMPLYTAYCIVAQACSTSQTLQAADVTINLEAGALLETK